MNCFVSRRELHDEITQRGDKTRKQQQKGVMSYILNKFNINRGSSGAKSLYNIIRLQFFLPYYQRWEKCNRTEKMFLTKYSRWLDHDIVLPIEDTSCLSTPKKHSHTPTTSENRGRPRKLFGQLSERSKRRKAKEMRENASSAELSYATVMSLRSEGDDAAAKLLKEVTTTTPSRGRRIRDSWRKEKKQSTRLSNEEALSLIVNANLSRHQYTTMRKMAVKHNHDLYPSYQSVLNAKKDTYPKDIQVTENKCEVTVQSLLEHTASRILSVLPQSNTEKNFTLHCKWGFDGSSGHSQYKQIWDQKGKSDESLFLTSLVPLRLVDSGSGDVAWKNPRPSSTRFCRPIRLQWVHETTEIAQAEREYIENQIQELQPFIMDNIKVQFSPMLTMIDGKICNALAKSSSMKCYICGARISQMNNLRLLQQQPEDTSNFNFGLSILHAHIRFFECILHISYRLDFKKWKARAQDGTLEMMKKRKKIVQDAFRNRLGLIVDIPKPGYGTTNDGNTSRRFFQNSKEASEITGVDYNLICHFGVILATISCFHDIDETRFGLYCRETAELFVKLYPWYYMPPTVHKILLHGPAIVKSFILPIGELSEEAIESINKNVRRFRQYHTRKISRIATNSDLFHRLFLSSDPVISNVGELPRRKRKELPSQVLQLLMKPEDEESEDSGGSNSEDE